MQVHDAAGRPLNATFSTEPEGDWVALIMESRSGRAAGRPGRNADYNPALTLLLERLVRLDATLADALVDSRKTQALGIPEAEFERKIKGMAKLNLVQQGGELAYLLLHDPEFRSKVRREHLYEAGKRVRLKPNIDALYS